jgi:subtilase family serine protease
MLRSTRTLIPLLVICLLFTACESANNQTNKKPQPPVQKFCPEDIIASNPTCLSPYILRTVYGIEPLIDKGFTGEGQTIIDLTSFDSPTLQQDVEVFDQTFNLPPANVQVISPLHKPQADPDNNKAAWAIGSIQDVEILHAIAPGAKIILLESPVAETEGTFGLPEFRKLLQYAITHQLGNIVSLRWDASELTLQNTQGQQELGLWNDLFQQGTTQDHITYFASSGSNGAADVGADGQNMATVRTVGFPGDSPWVTSVGGTSLTVTSAGLTLFEKAWSDAGDGNSSGGGFSHIYPMSSYQKLLPLATQQQFNNQRGIPDVSADEDPNTGLAIYATGHWYLAGGNSATPIWAGIQAIANQMAGRPLGFINPGLYKLAAGTTYQQDFYDVTEGNNDYLSNGQTVVQGYSAAPGWDPVTGLGTPNARKLIPDLIAALK